METAVKRHAAEAEVSAVAGNPAAAARPLLETRGICKRYGGTQALADLSLTVSPGHVQALVGAN